jgi:glycosyltransferase involved in cell wall biosynthesis
MDNYPLVSIVLATYNGEKFITQQMDSLLHQSYPNTEIIVVDDGSKDATINILRDYTAKHKNITIFKNEANLGFIKNFEKGCSLANGEYISLCDQDDYWLPDKIKNCFNAIGNSAMVYCNSMVCNEHLGPSGRKISDIVNCRPFNNCLEQAIFCRIYGHATLFKKELFIKARPFLDVIPHDWWLSYIATFNGGITYLDQVLVYYRQHSSNLFGAVGGKKRQHHKQDKKAKKLFEIDKIRKRINAFYAACPTELAEEKQVLKRIADSYESFSITNNIKRVGVFLKYRDKLLASKKHSAIHRFLFSLKMFAKIK